MYENTCQQCKNIPNGPSNRLVQDACGHKKCRACLLEDDEHCKQCENESGGKRNLNKSSPIEIDTCDINGDSKNEIVLNNHTAVIQINGKVSNDATVNGEENIITENSKNNAEDFIDSSSAKSTEELYSPQESLKTDDIGKKTYKKKDKRSYKPIDVPSHITVVSDPLSYHCTICDKKFITKTHVKYHTYCTGATKPYKCDVCQKEFILRAQLDVHSYKHRSSKPHICQICKKSFSDRSKLTRHSAVHSTVKSNICSICGNAYRSKESLRLHSVTHKGEKPYGCKLCTSRFNNVSNLNKHTVTHSKEKSHMCDQCGKRFKQKLSLAVHRKSHLRIRAHQCEICLRAFVNSKDLKRHSLIHAETRGYTCGICKSSFRRKDNLRRHMKNTHPGKMGDVISTVVLPPSTSAAAAVAAAVAVRRAPVDNPNAIKVITSAAAPATFDDGRGGCGGNNGAARPDRPVIPTSVVQSDCRADGSGVRGRGCGGTGGDGSHQQTTVINGPIKLAFKTPAFKSHYNINRDFNYVPPSQCQNSHDMAESIDICQKILSTNSTSGVTPPRNIICKAGPTPEEICQKILAPYSHPPLHYETSFQNRKHAMIKNIKFKVPVQYTSNFKEGNKSEGRSLDLGSNSAFAESVGVTSVIVNNNTSHDSNMHWRRRTSQNLGLKN